MKNLIRIALILLLMGYSSLIVFSQQKSSEKMYDDLRGMDEVTYLSLSKNLMQFMDFDVESDDEEQTSKVTGDLKEVRLLIFKPEEKPDKNFIDQVRQYMKRGNYSLVENDESDDNSEVWVQRKGRKVYECHVIFQGEQNGVLLSFFGNFKIEDVKKMRKKMEDYEE